MRALVSLLTTLLIGAAPVAAGPLAQREVLPNGLTLLVAERPGVPIVMVAAHVRAGAVLDPPDAAGLANLTAELLGRGTTRRTGPDLDRAIEFVGGSLDADAGRDGATVSLGVLRKDLGLGLDLLSEMLRAPVFPEDELRRKVGQLQAALRRDEESPETVGGRALSALLYPGHPYARPASGTVESVGRLTREQVVAFHRERYRPDQTVITVAGDVTREVARREVLARLQGWVAPVAAPPVVPPAPPVVTPSAQTITRDLTQATVLLGRPAIRHGHPDYFPLIVANYVLGGGSASRLYTRVREERGLAYAVSSALSAGRFGAALSVGLQTRNEAAGEALDLVREEMRRLGRDGVGPAELDLAKSYLIGSFPLRLDTTGKVVHLLIGIEELGLGLDYPDRYRAEVARVAAADVQRVAATYLDPAAYSVVVVRGR